MAQTGVLAFCFRQTPQNEDTVFFVKITYYIFCV